MAVEEEEKLYEAEQERLCQLEADKKDEAKITYVKVCVNVLFF